MMSRKMANILHLKPGDRATIVPIKGRREPLTIDVATIVDSYIGLAVYADIQYLNRIVGEVDVCSGVQLAVNHEPRERLQLDRQLKQLPGVQSINARSDTIDNLVNTVVKTQRIFIGLLVVFAGVIFFSSLLNTSLISLAERRREVATFLVLGYTPWQVGRLFLRESLVVTSLGVLMGLPLGYMLAYILAMVYDTEMFRFPLVAPWNVWASTIVLAALFAISAHLVVQKDIHKLDWLEASRTKE
jgi:putative ABC transport system permease protein